MRLITFFERGGPRLGVWLDDDRLILDLQAAAPDEAAYVSMLALIAGGDAPLDRARSLAAAPPPEALLETAAVRLLAPLPVPEQIRDFSPFEEHMLRSGAVVLRMIAERNGTPPPDGPILLPKVWYEQPIYYKANRFSVGNPGDDVPWPTYSRMADYELEMAAVIGRKGRDIAAADATPYIFGYTIYNDFSARDAQGKEMGGPFGPAKGKDFDGSIILGPCIVTADAFDPQAATMTAHVNGERWSSGSIQLSQWRFEDMIAHVSAGETIYPGEVFGGGTIGGGCGLEYERFLRDGDVVEMTITGIGTIRNRVTGAQLGTRA